MTDFFYNSLKKSCFPDCWKVLPMVLVFKNIGKTTVAKNYLHVSLFSAVSKSFERLVKNSLADQFEQHCTLFRFLV